MYECDIVWNMRRASDLRTIGGWTADIETRMDELVRHLDSGCVSRPWSEVPWDHPFRHHGVPIQPRHYLDVHRPLERLPIVVLQHPVRAPCVLHWHELVRVCHLDGHGPDVARSAHVLDQYAQPVWARSRVYPEGNVLAFVLARHSLVEYVVQTSVAKLTVLPRQSHGIESSSTEIEGLLSRAAICASGAKISYHHLRAPRIAQPGPVFAIKAFNLVALSASETIRVNGWTASHNLRTIRCASQLGVATVSSCTKEFKWRPSMSFKTKSSNLNSSLFETRRCKRQLLKAQTNSELYYRALCNQHEGITECRS